MLDPALLVNRRIRPLRRSEYDRLVDQGVFEGERVELLNGALIEMTPQKSRHAGTVQKLGEIFRDALRGRATVRGQLPLALLEYSEPEPDLAVVPKGDYLAAHPTTALLVIEVADSSLETDLELKSGIYATARIPEYWVVDLANRELVVHRAPREGRYTKVERLGPAKHVSPKSFPSLRLKVAELVP